MKITIEQIQSWVDLPEKFIGTTTALQSIIPSDPTNAALCVMLNNNIESGLFICTALSIITDSKILY